MCQRATVTLALFRIIQSAWSRHRDGCSLLAIMWLHVTYNNRRLKLLRASAWETGADLEMKVGRLRLKLAHKVVMWTYVICQSFRFNDCFFSRVLDISPLGVPRDWFSVQFWPLSNLSFSKIQLISDKTKTVFVIPYPRRLWVKALAYGNLSLACGC